MKNNCSHVFDGKTVTVSVFFDTTKSSKTCFKCGISEFFYSWFNKLSRKNEKKNEINKANFG